MEKLTQEELQIVTQFGDLYDRIKEIIKQTLSDLHKIDPRYYNYPGALETWYIKDELVQGNTYSSSCGYGENHYFCLPLSILTNNEYVKSEEVDAQKRAQEKLLEKQQEAEKKQKDAYELYLKLKQQFEDGNS